MPVNTRLREPWNVAFTHLLIFLNVKTTVKGMIAAALFLHSGVSCTEV